MFTATIKNGFLLKSLVIFIKNYTQKIEFTFKESGIYISQQDRECMTLINAEIKRENLFDYTLNKPFRCSINAKNLDTLLKDLQKKDIVTLKINKDEMSINVFKPSKNTNSENTIKIVEQSMQEMNEIPDELYNNPYITELTNIPFKKAITINKNKMKIDLSESGGWFSISSTDNIMSMYNEYGKLKKNEKVITRYYNSKIFEPFTKLNNLTKIFRIYNPKSGIDVDECPIKIKIDIDTIGSMNIFVRHI